MILVPVKYVPPHIIRKNTSKVSIFSEMLNTFQTGFERRRSQGKADVEQLEPKVRGRVIGTFKSASRFITLIPRQQTRMGSSRCPRLKVVKTALSLSLKKVSFDNGRVKHRASRKPSVPMKSEFQGHATCFRERVRLN